MQSPILVAMLHTALESGSTIPAEYISSYELPRDKTNVAVRPAKTQISLGIRPVWSESSLCAQWVAKGPSFLHADSEDSDQTGRMPRLIWVFRVQAFFMRTAKTLIRLGGCPGWSESSLGVHSLCWFCHEAAHRYLHFVIVSRSHLVVLKYWQTDYEITQKLKDG